MKWPLSRWGAALVLLVASVGSAAWPGALPRFRLLDPLGAEFTDEQLAPRGVVLVVTAPTNSQGDAQREWHAALEAHSAAQRAPVVVMLEDMSQSWFRPMVIAEMKKRHRPGAPIVLLLDESGATRKACGVAENATVVFAFAPGGKQVAVETGSPSPARVLRLLEAATRQ